MSIAPRQVMVSVVAVVVMAADLMGVSARMAPARAVCGPDEMTALWSALARMPVDRVTGRRWAGAPLQSNYNPCADLSAILVGIEGGTASSPIQALMFHRGTFLGTGTWKAYGFTSLDAGASTGDTVVLNYRSGQSCNACADGTVTTVRYHWNGSKVEMLDPPPPD
ncbi:LppP/LprE family lipoprotein [Mycolicibacterium farcinogenes]|uniref:LppP/LprE family lipoprotein n=1 Tax=Mycolicibacterium farcinogenes TaxID=1802 RepID=UPI001C8CF93B|nr:LppP/LprE family lipoprotein [Mycolicibacterium farcinogenes]QZH62661.1 LppP/LprE family lipoprotein [Mycolicibacterium farcinogenes]